MNDIPTYLFLMLDGTDCSIDGDNVEKLVKRYHPDLNFELLESRVAMCDLRRQLDRNLYRDLIALDVGVYSVMPESYGERKKKVKRRKK